MKLERKCVCINMQMPIHMHGRMKHCQVALAEHGERVTVNETIFKLIEIGLKRCEANRMIALKKKLKTI